jgi:hypothetical protein
LLGGRPEHLGRLVAGQPAAAVIGALAIKENLEAWEGEADD